MFLLALLVGGGAAAWTHLMPWWQGRSDTYSAVPPASAVFETKGSDIAQLSEILKLEEDRGYLSASRGYTSESTARWARYDPDIVTVSIEYRREEATTRQSGTEVAEGWIDSRVTFLRDHFVSFTKAAGIGDEAIETYSSGGAEVYVRAGNVTITVNYYVAGARGADTADQLQSVARNLAKTAVEKLKKT
ncbi:hypothetical protein QF037_009816 [Streptomyces canus]|uniref:hypothetical protein n=1 Tax=Streptomyces canus TaxID=58343 RepID=UPI002785688A|nr:hypothetical protein [Streptomyces canus]MDQ0605471.1 hypothetical protein [Streptomyces canus]